MRDTYKTKDGQICGKINLARQHNAAKRKSLQKAKAALRSMITFANNGLEHIELLASIFLYDTFKYHQLLVEC